MAQTVTNIVPVALIEPANHTFVVLGQAQQIDSISDGRWQDSGSNLYAVTSGDWTDRDIASVTSPAIIAALAQSPRMVDFLELGVDVAKVQAAQGSYMFYSDAAAAQLHPDKITAFVSDDPLPALAAMGLSAVEIV
ncbi:hypothetical protein [Ruegeria halocynthiae]|uniref:hypothetical protein n=1 Tax=Ruegeria halocynthiae TaxID=985054 RepID=UPI0005671B62|nr:hypothetical protein [Ruegeria halocynthiae]